jgi:alginate O-acetyltransferase complex protein AlgJ
MDHAFTDLRLKRAANVVLIAMFFILLWLPGLDTFLHFDHASPFNEKRPPAQFPQFQPGPDSLKQYITGLEAYFNDHFGGRNQLFHWHNQLQQALFGGRSDVMLGKDGWLYFDENHMQLAEHYLGILQFSPQELLNLKKIHENRRDWLAQRGIQYMFIIAPDKQSIYPEYLPSWLKPMRHHTKLDQFVDYMRAHSSVTVLDLRPALRDAKQIAPTYYQTDSHWNSFGGFVVCEEIIKHLPQTTSQAGRLSLASFELKKEKLERGDLMILLGVYGSEDDLVLVPKTSLPPMVKTVLDPTSVVPTCFTSNARAAGTCIVFRDSFGPALMPFLGYHFKTVGYFWSPGGFDPQTIEETKPDIVISEIVERHFNVTGK